MKTAKRLFLSIFCIVVAVIISASLTGCSLSPQAPPSDDILIDEVKDMFGRNALDIKIFNRVIEGNNAIVKMQITVKGGRTDQRTALYKKYDTGWKLQTFY